MKAKYEIVVTRITLEKEMVAEKWQPIGSHVVEGSDKLGTTYGYPPSRKQEVEKREQIFHQTLEALDLSRLVVAIQNEAKTPAPVIYDPQTHTYVEGVGLVERKPWTDPQKLVEMLKGAPNDLPKDLDLPPV